MVRQNLEEGKINAEQALQQCETWLNAIVRRSPIPMFVIDTDHRIIHWNLALEKYSGIRAEEVIGTNRQWRAFYPEERPCMADLLVDGAEDKISEWYKGKYVESTLLRGAYEVTDFFPHMGESGVWLYISAVAIRDVEGRIIGAVETLEDITERKKAEEALRESEEKYRKLFDSMLEGFAYCRMIYDSEGKPSDWIYLSVNPVFEEITGLKNITGIEVTKAIPGIREAYPELFEVYGRVAKTGKPENFDINFTPILKWLHISVYSPEKGFFIAVFEDITERRHVEEERETIRSWQAGVNRILESVLAPAPFDRKLKIITDGVVETFGADFCRIWLIEAGDLCEKGCVHAKVTEGPHACRYRDRCLHLKASSGRYTHINGKVHRRVPFGAYKIGRIASGEELSFLTNDVQHDPRVHDHEWARELGLVSFAGYRLKPPDDEVMGVFALFAKFEMSPDMDAILKGLSRALSLVIQKEIAEEKVTRSRDYYLKLFNDFPNPIWRSDTSAKCDYFNKEWIAFTGRTLEQEMGDGWVEGVHPDDLDRCVETYLAAFKVREPFEMEYRLRHHDGTFHWLLDSGKPFYDPDGNFAGYIGACYDINDRKQAETAILASEEKYRAFFNTSIDSVFITTIDGKWADFNDAAIRIFGYQSREELMNAKISDLYADPADRKTHIQHIIEKGYSLEYPVNLRKKDGTIINTLITSVARKDNDGNVIGFQGTIRDITERKRAEEALREANKKLNMLSTITRHDILNQIMGIRGYLELSKNLVDEPKIREYMERENDAVDTIQKQIEFTRYYQNIGVEEPKWQDVGEIIGEAAGQLTMAGIRIENAISGLEIFADPLVGKVFYNLMENSLRHGEHVTVISVSSSEVNDGLIIFYQDNGVGISEEDKKKLFERGFGKHTGLGLFLSREILSITGITIRETGEPGKGVNFEIIVPKRDYRHV